jgi:hypothetical protein
MYWRTVYFMRLRVTEMTDHSLRMKGNVASDITRGFLSSGDEDGTPYAQDSPLTTSWLLSKQQKHFCRIPPIYEPLVNLAVNGFCRTFKGWTHTGRARLFRDAPNLLTSYKDKESTHTNRRKQYICSDLTRWDTWLVQWRHPSDPETYPGNWLSY